MVAEKKVLFVERWTGGIVDFGGYTHIRAYHACRTDNILSYQEGGIRPFSPDSAKNDAIQKLKKYASEERIIQKFNELWPDSDANLHPVTWLALDKSELLGESCHYLIYGSEFLNALAMHLGCRDKLKKYGKPTIIVCDIPVEDVTWGQLADIAQMGQYGLLSSCSIWVHEVKPEMIVNFIFPSNCVTDPFTGMRYKLS